MNKTFLIFDLPVQFIIPKKNVKAIRGVTEQFGIYPVTTEPARISIELTDEAIEDDGLNNPSTHKTLKNGFWINYSKYSVLFIREKELKIQVRLKKQGNSLIRYLKKVNNIQYAGLEERFVQIVWENCLYPAMYFFEDRTLIHSSGFAYKNKEAFLLGGTGGVGKTSLEIQLAQNGNFSFLNDDIAVIGADGMVYQNNSWPKIYSYNLQDNQSLKALIFENRSLDDRFMWYLKKSIFGADKTRRIIDPLKMFPSSGKGGSVLKKYILLSRGDYSKLQIKEMDKALIPDINVKIIQTEFAEFEKHLNWHSCNARLAGYEPIVDLNTVHKRWLKMNTALMDETNCYLLEIPKGMSHQNFLDEAHGLIENLFS